jgi:hypothetical protein
VPHRGYATFGVINRQERRWPEGEAWFHDENAGPENQETGRFEAVWDEDRS